MQKNVVIPPVKTNTVVRVLSVGYIESLLNERNKVLSGAGLAVMSVTRTERAISLLHRHPFDVVVIGHAVAPEERNRVAQAARQKGRIAIIFLYSGSIADAT